MNTLEILNLTGSVTKATSTLFIIFDRKNGYIEMPFNDQSGEPSSPIDIAMGKFS